MIKKIIGWPVAWGLFWIGHLWSKLGNLFPDDPGEGWLFTVWDITMYQPYNWLMMRSSDVQDWAELDEPWVEVNDDT